VARAGVFGRGRRVVNRGLRCPPQPREVQIQGPHFYLYRFIAGPRYQPRVRIPRPQRGDSLFFSKSSPPVSRRAVMPLMNARAKYFRPSTFAVSRRRARSPPGRSRGSTPWHEGRLTTADDGRDATKRRRKCTSQVRRNIWISLDHSGPDGLNLVRPIEASSLLPHHTPPAGKRAS